MAHAYYLDKLFWRWNFIHLFNALDQDDEFSDSRALEKYRAERLNQMKQAAVRNRFGEVLNIVKDDWIREVRISPYYAFTMTADNSSDGGGGGDGSGGGGDEPLVVPP